jgi:glycosyltransferase involved in cell wall biosynthesis
VALLRAAGALRRWLAGHPVDLLHTHYRRPTLVARRLQRRLGLPILYTTHLSDLSLAWPRRWFTDFGDRTHVASEEARKWAVDVAGVPSSRVVLIPHGVDPQRFPRADADEKRAARQSLGLGDDDLVAAYVGRLDHPKNEHWLVDLALAARTKLPQLRIVLAGEGPHEQDLRVMIAADGLDDRVRLLGHQDPLLVYRAADAVLLPSAREGFSLVCAEAMSVGVPVLRTRTAGTGALIVEGMTGQSVEVDRDAFVAAAIAFLGDRPALSRMGAAAAAHVREHFGFDRQVRHTMDLYREMATLIRPR